MKFYTKIINEKTKECLIINQIEAKKQGLQEMKVEFGYDGKAYLEGYAPQKSQDFINQEKILEYQRYLTDTDYVIIKISEAMIIGDKQLTNELKNKYADVLTDRSNKRKQINEFEEESKKQREAIEQTQEKDIISIEEVNKIPKNIDGDQVKVADSIKIISDQAGEEQDKVMETMDINKKEKNKLEEENSIEEKKEPLFM